MKRSRSSAAQLVTCELVAVGRGVGARPAFVAGPVFAIGAKGRRGAGIGDLVTARFRGAGAEVVSRLGRADDVRTVMDAVITDAGLARAFPPEAIAEAERQVAAAETVDDEREDLTAQRVITIDPEGAKDHDDAIAVAREGDAIRLWVHIADVSYFVPAGGAVDIEAARRGTSVYVPGTVVPMLPPRLSTDICSLRPGVDRKVVTADLLVGLDGNVIHAHFFRSVIRSQRRLTYPEVDAVFAGGALGDPSLEADLATARTLAERLRAVRMERGALEIVSDEPSFQFDSDGVLINAVFEGQTAAHSLVEECMIAANEAVARELIARERHTVFRVHPHPDARSVERLYARLEAIGVATPPLHDGPLTPEQAADGARAAASAVAAHVARSGSGRRALPGIVLRALQRAHYDIGPPGHSGLAAPAYLHFTSPIRRYPDLLAHRTLLDALGIDPGGPDLVELAVAAADSSEREQEAQRLERDTDRIALAFLLAARLREGHRDEEFAGEVVGLVPGGVFVALPPVFDGFLPARLVADEEWRLDDAEVTLMAHSGRRIRLGDVIAVQVTEIEPLRGRVTLRQAGTDVVPRHSRSPQPGRRPPPRVNRRRR